MVIATLLLKLKAATGQTCCCTNLPFTAVVVAAVAAAAAAMPNNVLCLMPGQSNQPAAVPMSEDERGELLRHLKLKWAALNAEYQKLGFVMDIGSKIKRHEAMEAQLAEIEKDIRTLEAGDVVLVVPDNGSGF